MRIFIIIKRYHSEIRCVFANDSAAIRMHISRKIRQYVWGIRCVFGNDFATIRMRIFTVKYVLTEKYVAYMSQNWQQYASVFYRHDVKM